jgi:hypothetical protein
MLKATDTVYKVYWDSIRGEYTLGTYRVLAVLRHGHLKVMRVGPPYEWPRNERMYEPVNLTKEDALREHSEFLKNKVKYSSKVLKEYVDNYFNFHKGLGKDIPVDLLV